MLMSVIGPAARRVGVEGGCEGHVIRSSGSDRSAAPRGVERYRRLASGCATGLSTGVAAWADGSGCRSRGRRIPGFPVADPSRRRCATRRRTHRVAMRSPGCAACTDVVGHHRGDRDREPEPGHDQVPRRPARRSGPANRGRRPRSHRSPAARDRRPRRCRTGRRTARLRTDGGQQRQAVLEPHRFPHRAPFFSVRVTNSLADPASASRAAPWRAWCDLRLQGLQGQLRVRIAVARSAGRAAEIGLDLRAAKLAFQNRSTKRRLRS